MKHDISHIQEELFNSAKRDSQSFLTSYLENEDDVIEALKSFNGIKTEIYLKNINKQLDDQIKFSCLFSDMIILNHTNSDIRDSHWGYSDPESKYFRKPQITMNSSYLKNLHQSFYEFAPIYIYRTDQETRSLATKYSTLFDAKKIFMRPLRGIAMKSKIGNDHMFHYVNPNTTNDHWFVDKIDQEALLLDNGLKPKDVIKLFDLTLPYFTDIDIKTLSDILQDETDLLSSFRAALKDVVTDSANDSKSINEIRQDILQPQIDKINRKFTHIKNIHQISVVGSVGTFTLSLFFGVYTGTEIKQLLATGVVAAAIALTASEIRYQNSTDKLKDNDYFLLWRIDRS